MNNSNIYYQIRKDCKKKHEIVNTKKVVKKKQKRKNRKLSNEEKEIKR